MKKIKFNQGFAKHTSIYAYVVYVLTDDYCDNYVRLRICPSFEEAIKFINQSFFKRNNYLDEKHDLIRVDDNRFYINKEIDKNMKYTTHLAYEEELDTREIYILIDTHNYIQYEDGSIAKIGEATYPNELVFNRD